MTAIYRAGVVKERCVWRHEFETLDQAREVIAAYIDHYHDRPPQPA
jgi:putative transposase